MSDDRPSRGGHLTTRIHAAGDTVPDVDTEALYESVEETGGSNLLEPQRGFPWLTMLLSIIVLTWLVISWLQAITWGHATHPILGWGLFVIGVFVGVVGLGMTWRVWRQRHQIDAITSLNRRLAEAEREGAMGQSVVELREAAEHLLVDSPYRQVFEKNLLGIDAGSHATELIVALERGYAEPDERARALIQREVVRTGLFIAASPYPALDLLLVAWRNARMVNGIAQIYGLKLSFPVRWRLYRMILQNMAFASATETVLDSTSEGWASNLLVNLGARAGQGVAVALYSLRIGRQAMRVSRVAPEQRPLVDRNLARLILGSIRERSAGTK
ncbi:MAG: YcjF family protein [Halothiobacillaceae bacterium]